MKARVIKAKRVTSTNISRLLGRLRQQAPSWNAPIVTLVAQQSRDPFQVLVSCILSLRTKDGTTAAASARLFARARTVEAMARLRTDTIARLIYPVGFYRTKAKVLKSLCRTLMERHAGKVPASMDDLLAIKGVGRKTANLVLTQGFSRLGICVDTHVHRICNRWGYVTTRTPTQTEMALRQRLPRRHWIEINDLLVAFGQTICHPTSPFCSRCPVSEHCPRIGVARSR